MRLNTKSKLPRLPASALKVSVGGWAGILPIIKSLPTEAELGCDNCIISRRGFGDPNFPLIFLLVEFK